MGIFEKMGAAIGAFSNNNFEEGWKKYGSALDELFDSDNKKRLSQRHIDIDHKEKDSLADNFDFDDEDFD